MPTADCFNLTYDGVTEAITTSLAQRRPTNFFHEVLECVFGKCQWCQRPTKVLKPCCLRNLKAFFLILSNFELNKRRKKNFTNLFLSRFI